MFSKVLLPSDLSEASDHVIQRLKGLKSLGTKKVVLLHALGIRHLDSMAPLLVQWAEPKLHAPLKLIAEQGLEAELDVATGLPMPAITRAAASHKASLIMIGSQGHSLSREMLLGGVATGVVHHATMPVLVVGIRVVEEQGHSRCETSGRDFRDCVLYATDFSDTAERAFADVRKLAESGAKEIILLHVQDRSLIDRHLSHRLDEFNRIDRGRLESLKAAL